MLSHYRSARALPRTKTFPRLRTKARARASCSIAQVILSNYLLSTATRATATPKYMPAIWLPLRTCGDSQPTKYLSDHRARHCLSSLTSPAVSSPVCEQSYHTKSKFVTRDESELAAISSTSSARTKYARITAMACSPASSVRSFRCHITSSPAFHGRRAPFFPHDARRGDPPSRPLNPHGLR